MDIDAEGMRTVVLRRSSDVGLGFSIMGGAGYEFPPVIYGIEKDSPAARSGLLEAGDIILAINEREVVKLSTKEVLKCLRLSGDIVNIKYKRDQNVVNRVRKFLSTYPHYVDEIQSPIKTLGGNGAGNRPSKIKPPNQISPVKSPPLQISPSKKNKLNEDQVDSRLEITNSTNITFTDDLFINHSHAQPQTNLTSPPLPTKSLIPVRSQSSNGSNSASTPTPAPLPTISSIKNTNGNSNSNISNKISNSKTPINCSTPFGTNAGNRKNYEAFVMTGDAILNVSKLRNDENVRTSPKKTTSKLTPLLSSSTTPPHQIYCERAAPSKVAVQLLPQLNDMSEDSFSSEISPPLPPPPPVSNSTSSSTSDSLTNVTVKSEALPPPPPSLMTMDDETTAHSQSNGIAIAEPAGIPGTTNSLNQLNNKTQEAFDLIQKQEKAGNSNNNEDTSISSSVMSDSGGEMEEETNLEMDQIDSNTNNTKKPKTNKTDNKSSFELETTNEDKGDGGQSRLEKERYNEYILFNGNSGGPTIPVTIEEEERSRSSGSRHSAQVKASGYEKMSNDSDDEVGLGCGESDEESSPRHGGLGNRVKKKYSNTTDSLSGGESSDGSDVESMRLAPVTKAVDIPSAERLAKRLYMLDGFKVGDVWRQLSKANDFSREVAMFFVKYFDFKNETLDLSLRKFLLVCPLKGETQERERVLTYFSSRYVECNPNFASEDAAHTLSCALMLINTDLHSAVRPERRMTCKDFIQNLAGLNDGQNFPESILKKLYNAIKSRPLTSPGDTEDDESTREIIPTDPSLTSSSLEFKRGYLKRKSIFEHDGKKTPLGKRSWKLYYCRLKELLLCLAPDENSKATVTQTIPPLKLHHSISSIASDYQKKPYVFSITLADKSQYLFQSSDSREMHSWIDNLNLNAAKFSSPALEAPCGSTKKFEKPLLPSAVSRLSYRDQLITHQGALAKWEEELNDLNQGNSSGNKRSMSKKEFKERTAFYKSEICRYKVYIDVIERQLRDHDLNGSGDSGGPEELLELQVLPNPSVLVDIDENAS